MVNTSTRAASPFATISFVAVDAVGIGHVEIHHDDVRLKPLGHRHGLAAVPRFADDLDVLRGAKHGAQAGAHHRVIVGEDRRES